MSASRRAMGPIGRGGEQQVVCDASSTGEKGDGPNERLSLARLAMPEGVRPEGCERASGEKGGEELSQREGGRAVEPLCCHTTERRCPQGAAPCRQGP